MEQARTPLRIGILGAARIAPAAIIYPAQASGHQLVAVASRDKVRAVSGGKDLYLISRFNK
jgi:predicted dehydrogenase